MAQTVGDYSEDAIIDKFFAPRVLGIGNDTALWNVEAGMAQILSCDALVEDVHFTRAAPPHLVGEKAARVNMSDIVADGGMPTAMLLSLSLPKDLPMAWLSDFMRGWDHALTEADAVLIGGDTTRSPQHIAINVTAIGHVPEGNRITRNGAKAGHLVAVTGALGGAALGLEVIQGQITAPSGTRDQLIAQHFITSYRGDFAAAARSRIAAMMDLSDGLALDLSRLCRSSGVGAVIQEDQVPLHPQAKAFGKTRDYALTAAEDYELLLVFDPHHGDELKDLAASLETPLTVIGQITEDPRFLIRNDDGLRPPPKSWNHFSDP